MKKKLFEQNCQPPQPLAFEDRQLSLFQDMLCNYEGQRKSLSNTIHFWDAVPKYLPLSKRRPAKPEVLSQTFHYGGKIYLVKIAPAVIESAREKRSIVSYPSAREEALEDVLRRLVIEYGQGFMDQHGVGVKFSIRGVGKLLKDLNRTMNFHQILDSLAILNQANIRVLRVDEDGQQTSLFATPIITSIGAISDTDLKHDADARWIVRFCEPITEAIQVIEYHQYDYLWPWQHRSCLARWMHKRMALNYRQASLTLPYQLLLSTVCRDSGLLAGYKLKIAVNKMQNAIEELREAEVIVSFKEERRFGKSRGGRPPLVDVLYEFTPHPKFIRDMKAAMKRRRQIQALTGDEPYPGRLHINRRPSPSIASCPRHSNG